ncbi:SNF2-related protein [Companilactobacillus allii]|uniref:SNF2-related protein n=1 Tax=Companilactobacillus allii TaxID=1847728 RepID=UPI001CEF6898|nr:SNF2-related protein [Companilactobacillus allii]USQ68503.1 SNF2-related protein [Companilactobacillus allii]
MKDSIKGSYTTSLDNLAEELYVPLLSGAKYYQRVSAYFSIKALSLYSIGLDRLAANGGQVQFILSKDISESDFDEMKKGYKYRDVLNKVSYIEKKKLKLNESLKSNLGDLAYMIANNQANIKIAFLRNHKGIFHDKFGLITDENDATVFFTGSANESIGGLRDNYESLSVDTSWDSGENGRQRILQNKERFSKLWNGVEREIITIRIDSLIYQNIKQYKNFAHSGVKEMNSKLMSSDEVTDSDKDIFKLEFIDNSDRIIFKDLTKDNISQRDRRLRMEGNLGEYCDDKSYVLKSDLVYQDIQTVIDLINERLKRLNKRNNRIIQFVIDPRIIDMISKEKYSIKAYKTQGMVLKDTTDSRYDDEFIHFSNIVQSEVVRKFKSLHLKAAFYEYMMQRAANFSVPGSGKTAMILGVFAYLNRDKIQSEEKINRILVISPINAFQSWKREFKSVFGNHSEKKRLVCIDTQDLNFDGDIRRNWNKSNLVLVNYESLEKYMDQLKDLINSDTMLVFDEVHRIKNPIGKRALQALELSKNAKSKFVLTGTPLPNSYIDIYNFLHILYGNEYESFFGWSTSDLKKPNYFEVQDINKKIAPFFWRTNKTQLQVPPADPDIFLVKKPSLNQSELAESIWSNEKSSLAIFIRLIQVSTNPELLKNKIDYSNMGFDNDIDMISKEDFYQEIDVPSKKEKLVKTYSDFDLSNIDSPKFDAGIELVKKLVMENKKILIWGIFVGTLEKINNQLKEIGIKSYIVYGATKHEDRKGLIDEFLDVNSEVNVLISNPQTLGESVSLHKSVHDAVYFEYNFNLTFMLQSRDRIHRLGLPPNQHTRYYYLQTKNESNSLGFIDGQIYNKLKEKEARMEESIDGDVLKPEISDDYLNTVRDLINSERKRMKL